MRHVIRCFTPINPRSSATGAAHMPCTLKQVAITDSLLPTASLEITGSENEKLVGVNSYKVDLRYDGTAYCGWQLQPGVRTIQGVLEKALEVITSEPRSLLDVRAAGRTDSGVHAVGQVAQFRSNKVLNASSTCRSINGLLDPDIRAMSVERTAPDWHPVFSATGKVYHYDVDTQRFHDPIMARYRLHHPRALDVAAMRAGAALLQGTHDFTQFSSLDPCGRVRNPVKTIWSFQIDDLDVGLRFKVHGSGFLYKMVRHMVGALLAVGVGRMSVADIAHKLELGSSVPACNKGQCRGYEVAPAKGLMLMHVEYPPHDNPDCLLYPQLEHDEFGRAFFTRSFQDASDG